VNLLHESLRYIQDNPDRFRTALLVHIRLSAYALALALALFVPLGVLTSRSRRIGPAIVSVVATLRVAPSIAVLFLLFPYRREIGSLFPVWDRTFTISLIALTVLAGPPLIINTDAGLRGVAAFMLESARGVGMNERQVFSRVQLPLAAPVIVSGVRTAAVEIIASATLAAFVGVGGLGRFITSGLTLYDFSILLVGAVPVALLALLAEATLAGVERLCTPPARPS
jgi:osmoprotectant transport system permease protein